jgi:hypothetical protein
MVYVADVPASDNNAKQLQQADLEIEDAAHEEGGARERGGAREPRARDREEGEEGRDLLERVLVACEFIGRVASGEW